ncbi:MAG TPA: glycoside hydrolase domain-containing protein [Candidatus Acidoferrales bacterium]|nr:glycoside hydrolase domain-containing protein [Candidatus Acidoferrales bacterium]
MAPVLNLVLTLCSLLLLVPTESGPLEVLPVPSQVQDVSVNTYLGFDRNDYPGDASLDALRRTFFFSGYWLDAPPGEASDSWLGKREILRSHGFGFLLLFNGRSDRQIKSSGSPESLGARDARAAVAAAEKEGFPAGAIIFLDQEEGGRMLPEQRVYLHAWADAVNASLYRAGVYCSGIPVKESQTQIIAANDIREHAGSRKIVFFVYNDACPPSPGCAFYPKNLSPHGSGISFAAVWQFAQSPRRKNLTRTCVSQYAADGNCYPPLPAGMQNIFVDLDIATSPDPSSGR